MAHSLTRKSKHGTSFQKGCWPPALHYWTTECKCVCLCPSHSYVSGLVRPWVAQWRSRQLWQTVYPSSGAPGSRWTSWSLTTRHSWLHVLSKCVQNHSSNVLRPEADSKVPASMDSFVHEWMNEFMHKRRECQCSLLGGYKLVIYCYTVYFYRTLCVVTMCH